MRRLSPPGILSLALFLGIGTLPAVGFAGEIRGTVRAAATGSPLPGIGVTLYTEFGVPVGGVASDAVGLYRFEGLPGGTYRAQVDPTGDYLGQAYPLRDCAPTDCGLGGDPIVVGATQIVSGIDFALVRAAAIEGRITDAFTGQPLNDVRLMLRVPGEEGFREFFGSDEQGDYRLDYLLPGTYLLNTTNFEFYVNEVFDNLPCGTAETPGCPLDVATPIVLEAGEVFRADFALEPGGVLAGTVREAVTGAPLQASVDLWSSFGRLVFGGTNAEGRFEFRGLGGGTYYLVAESFSGPHVQEIYDGLPCPGGRFSLDCDPTTGTGIPVSTGQTSVADFVLDRFGRVSGRILDAGTGAPIDNVQVIALRTDQEWVGSGSSNQGAYSVDVRPGPFKLIAVVFDGNYIGQLYPGIPCVGGVCDPGPGATLVSQLNGHIENVDFRLAEGGILAGSVTTAGQPIFIPLGLYLADGKLAFLEGAGDNGRYEFDGLATGSYFVTTRAAFEVVNEVYDDVPCMLDFCDPELIGTPVAVTAGETTEGIDFVLDIGGAVTGQVRPPEGDVLGLAFVNLWTEDGEFVAFGRAFPGGYQVSQLPPGSYRATTSSFFRFADELYDDLPCPGGGCDVEDGDPIEVRRGEITAGVDFDLGRFAGVPCSEEDGRICLGEGRFQVAMRWADGAGGGSGAATGVPLTDDSGYFWFFREENVEALVKVLDACVPPFDRLWVFAAGLTNVATELEVLDTWTGVVYRHSTDQGPAFAPLLDTSAFATCGAPEPSGSGAAAAGAPAGSPVAGRPPALPAQSRRSEAGSGGSGPCVEGPTRLCLGGGRFAVEATWTTRAGSTGMAQAAPLTADTGTFWFFNSNNVELIVKVLDACGPPFDRFWVFAAGLTDVEVELHVTDLAAGETWTRTNPQGREFQPILDTAAFDTCD